MMNYRTVDDWLDEMEGFSSRRERLPPDALQWVVVAWGLGAAAERREIERTSIKEAVRA